MKPLAETRKPARIAASDKAETRKGQAVLEQMYGYFSYQPLPLEAEARRAA